MLNEVKLFGFSVRTVFPDGEGAMMKMAPELESLGIMLNSTAKESLPLVERKMK